MLVKVKRGSLPPEVQRAREWELNRRHSTARHRALRELADMHPRLYADLLRQHRAQIDWDSGPLPGDGA